MRIVDDEAVSVWAEVRAIEWSRFHGCTGESWDVPAALEALRWGDPDDDDYGSAYFDFLLGHVWHQGMISSITAPLLPFVFEIMSERDDEPSDLADVLVCCAAAGRDAAKSTGDEASSHGRAVLAVFVAQEARLRAWIHPPSNKQALAVMLCVPSLSERILAGEDADPATVLSTILHSTRWLDDRALDWAMMALAPIDHPVAVAARQVLAAPNRPLTAIDCDRLAVLGSALDGRGSVEERLEPLRARFGVKPASG